MKVEYTIFTEGDYSYTVELVAGDANIVIAYLENGEVKNSVHICSSPNHDSHVIDELIEALKSAKEIMFKELEN